MLLDSQLVINYELMKLIKNSNNVQLLIMQLYYFFSNHLIFCAGV